MEIKSHEGAKEQMINLITKPKKRYQEACKYFHG